MAEFDTIIKDGMIVDGTRVPRYKPTSESKDGRLPRSAVSRAVTRPRCWTPADKS